MVAPTQLLVHVFQPFKLSQTQLAIVALLLRGLPNAQIAYGLQLKVTTIKSHLTHIYRKTNVSNRAEFIIRFQAELHTLNGVANPNELSLITDLNIKLTRCLATHRTSNQIRDAWSTAVHSYIPPQVSHKLLKHLLDELRLV
jgi:DNA-binding CsgD family transcriptional regulator